MAKTSAASAAPPFSGTNAEVLAQLKVELAQFVEATDGHFEMDADDEGLMRGAVKFYSCPEETYIVVIAVHKDQRKNSLTKIRCHQGNPLGGYAYDTVNEAYIAECADHLVLGLVPISFRVEIGGWKTYIPMPETVLSKYFNDKQRKSLAQYKQTIGADHTFQFMQILH